MTRHPHLIHGARWRTGARLPDVPSGRHAARRRDVARRRPGAAGTARRLYGSLLAPAHPRVRGRHRRERDHPRRRRSTRCTSTRPASTWCPTAWRRCSRSRPKLRDARVAEALGLDEPFVLWVGSLRARDPRKGLDTLLEAMESARRRRPAAGAGRCARARGRPPRRRRVAAARAARALRTGRRRRPRLAVPAGVGGGRAVDPRGLRAHRARGDGVRLRRWSPPRSATSRELTLRRGRAGAAGRSRRAGRGDRDRCSTEPVRDARMRHAGVDRAAGYTWASTADDDRRTCTGRSRSAQRCRAAADRAAAQRSAAIARR